MNTTLRLIAACAAGGILFLGTTACTISSVPRDDVAQQIATQLGKQGIAIDNNTVTCPADLPADVGASSTCEFHTGGQPVGAVVTVTSVDGDRAAFDITTEARPIPRALLQDAVGAEVGKQVGVAIDDTSCAGDLPAQTGGHVTCTVMANGVSADVVATVTGVTGGQVDYSIADA